jgi:GT2 family glycosyltransferase
MALFEIHPRAAVLAASIYHPHESQPDRTDEVKVVTDYAGCGYAIRADAYHQTTGHIDRAFCYGIEEVDLAMQLHAIDWTILQCSGLRVYHDTQLTHHSRPDIVASTLQNVALRAFLRYPIRMWPRGLFQLGNMVSFMIKSRRFDGLGRGLWGIPSTLMDYASQRRQLPTSKIRSYLNARPKLRS